MPDLGSDLFTLLKDGYNHDLAVVCDGGERVQVHRIILAARSVVFRTMVEVDMRERNTATIEIKDFEAGVVKELINYIYSDRITSNFSDLAELMSIAHQYEIWSLVDHCSKRLIEEVSVDNVALLSNLAETLEVEELFGKCAQIVAENYERLDTKTLDTVPSSIFRKSLDARSKMSVVALSSGEPVDQNIHYMANFITSNIDPETATVRKWLQTTFTVNRSTKLTGIGLYIKGIIGSGISMDLSVSTCSIVPHRNRQQEVVQLEMSALKFDVNAADRSKLKHLKIVFPVPVEVEPMNPHYCFKVQITVGTEWVNFGGDCSKSPMSLPMKKGELIVVIHPSIYHDKIQIPVLYFED